jgi:hypothetical protein
MENKKSSEPLVFGYRYLVRPEDRTRDKVTLVTGYVKPKMAHELAKIILDKAVFREDHEGPAIMYSIELVLLTPEEYLRFKACESRCAVYNFTPDSVICPGAKTCNQVDPATGTDYKLSGGCRHYTAYKEDCTCHTSCAGYHCTLMTKEGDSGV